MRPFQAGLLGADTLLVLDEAHLVPPFEHLIEKIALDATAFGPRGEDRKSVVPALRLLSLSATGRTASHAGFTLQDDDRNHAIVNKRLSAKKRLVLRDVAPDGDLVAEFSDQAWALSGEGTKPLRCIVFCDLRETAKKVHAELERRINSGLKKGAQSPSRVELLVGGRRVFERERATTELRRLGFLAGARVDIAQSTFLIATAAGEVGVDLDADHMVSDLVAWERMVQRLGRVNRRGDGDATVIVLVEPETKPAKKSKKPVGDPEQEDETTESPAPADAKALRRRACKAVLERLPVTGTGRDASPGALQELKKRSEDDAALAEQIRRATTPPPLRPALSRALVDAWAMTSMREHPGRPEVGPWLRGWDDERPQTTLVWRRFLPVRKSGSNVSSQEIEAYFEAAPPHRSEMLEIEAYVAAKELKTRVLGVLKTKHSADGVELPEAGEEIGVLLTSAGDLERKFTLQALNFALRESEKFVQALANRTLVLDARLGGLAPNGLLDGTEAAAPLTVEDPTRWSLGKKEGVGSAPTVRFRVRSAAANEPRLAEKGWRERLRFAAEVSAEGMVERWISVEKWRDDAETEEDRSASFPQLLVEHQSWTEERARKIARRLGLNEDYTDMLATAAALHDEGKRARLWQRAFNALSDGTYAKTQGPVNTSLLGGYRHEFGSLPYAERSERLQKLSNELRELALHLIAAHHGFARPLIDASGCEDAPPTELTKRQQSVALRFANLQRDWGPWGLAWWESLLRAADQQASRDNDQRGLLNKSEAK